MLQGDRDQMAAIGARRVHAAQLCVLFVSLTMAANSLISPLLLDESPLPQRVLHVLLGSLPAVAMFGFLAWSRRKPGFALLAAALVFLAVASTNLLSLAGGNRKTIGIAVVGALVVVILRGAYSGQMVSTDRR